MAANVDLKKLRINGIFVLIEERTVKEIPENATEEKSIRLILEQLKVLYKKA